MKIFVWKHNLINIHEIMMMNILHQLMKKMIMHLLIWIKFLLKTHLSVNRKRKNVSIRFKDLSELDKLDTRFKNVSSFTELKTFFNFSNVKQWIDVEQNTIMKQIIFVIISLLIDKWSHVVNFVRVFVDFILIAQYRSHDEQTLRYLNQTFFRVNFFKSVFRETRQFVQENENEHFNFSKFHVMSHYFVFIRKYDTTDDYDISHDEIKYKYMIKQYHDKTNKKKTFQEQLIQHNKRRMKILIMKNIMRYEKKCQSFVVNEVIKFTNIKTTRDSFKLSFLRKCFTKNSQSRHIFEFLQSKTWCTTKELNVFMNISNLIFALIVFIREKRETLNHLMTDSRNKYRREKDFIWIWRIWHLFSWFHNMLNIKKT
jgi:hypothetical protein